MLSRAAETLRTAFLARRLALSACAGCVLASFCLAMRGALPFADAVLFAWLILPAGILAASTNQRLLAAILWPLSFLAAGVTAASGADALHPTAFDWLMAAAVSSAFSSRPLVTAVSTAAAVIAALSIAASSLSASMSAAPRAEVAVVLVPAAMLAVVLALGFASARAQRLVKAAAQARQDADLAEILGCAVMRCDQSGLVSAAGLNCEALLGLPQCELMGRGFFEHVHVADRPVFLKAISDAKEGEGVVAVKLRWRCSRPGGHPGRLEPIFLPFEMRVRHGSTIFLGDGLQKSEMIAVLRAVDCGDDGAADPEARLPHELFARMGHELRAPLAAISGFSELLAEPDKLPGSPGKEREYARIIHQSAGHLLAVIDAALGVSVGPPESPRIALERFAISPLIDLCCDMVKLQAKEGGIALTRACERDLSEIVSDRRLLTQILLNLLANAIKFTPRQGSVSVQVKKENDDSLLVEVSDTGIGIATGDLDRLGAPYFRGKTAASHAQKGSGLGLSLVRSFVGLLGGTITVASEPGKGTCVRVLLPIAGIPHPARPWLSIEALPQLPAMRVKGFPQATEVKKIA